MAQGVAAQDTVKVGMVMPLTGTLADAGKQVVAGARLYMSQHGDTVAGKRIEVVVKDDTSSAETAKRLIQEAIINDRIDVLAGGPTAGLMAAAPVITEAKKPTVIMLSSTSAVIDKSSYFVRTSCTQVAVSSDPGRLGGQERPQEGCHPGVRLFAGLEAEATFKARYLAAGGAIAESIRVPLKNPDFSPFLQRAGCRAAGPSSCSLPRCRP
jgi:branched-chain amino acid transport system substrate-binding protein